MKHADTFVTDAELDRLVDGELPPPEYRQVLIRLEAENHGWRRLALAVLEAQALRQTCPQLLPAPSAVASPQSLTATTRRDRPSLRQCLERLVSVSAVACAFFLGLAVRSPFADAPQPTAPQLAAESADPRPSVVPATDRLQVVFPEDSGEWSEPVELPVVDSSDARAQVWMSQESMLPAAVRKALRESGRQVSEQRQWLQVELADGRQGYVPVSDLEVSRVDPSHYP